MEVFLRRPICFQLWENFVEVWPNTPLAVAAGMGMISEVVLFVIEQLIAVLEVLDFVYSV